MQWMIEEENNEDPLDLDLYWLSLGFGLRKGMTHVGLKSMTKEESNQSHG